MDNTKPSGFLTSREATGACCGEVPSNACVYSCGTAVCCNNPVKENYEKSKCYPPFRTAFDRDMQEKHSNCCLPGQYDPCYPQIKRGATEESYAGRRQSFDPENCMVDSEDPRCRATDVEAISEKFRANPVTLRSSRVVDSTARKSVGSIWDDLDPVDPIGARCSIS